MNPVLALYHPRNLTQVADLSTWAKVNASYNSSLLGGGSGYFDLEFENEYGEQLPIHADSLFEMSHYVRYGTDTEVYPGVISSAEIMNAGSILRVNVIGAMEYFESIEVTPFYKSDNNSITLPENDSTFTMGIYGNNVVSILNSLMKNVEITMRTQGYNDNLFNFFDLESYETGVTDGFTQSYRINGFETKTLANCIEDITQDHDMQLLKIHTSQDINNNFSFIFEIIDSLDVKDVDFSGDNFYSSISFDSIGKENRSYSVAQGTDLMNRQKLERVPFNDNVAYSSLIGDSAKTNTNSVKKEAESAKENAIAHQGTFTFTSYSDDFKLLEYLNVSGLRDFLNKSLSGVVVEKNVEGSSVTYKIQVSPQITKSGSFSKPETGLRKLIFNPLHTANKLSKNNAKAGNKRFTTGWRQ